MSTDIAKDASDEKTAAMLRNVEDKKKINFNFFSTPAGVSSDQKRHQQKRHFPNKMNGSNIFGDSEDKDGSQNCKESTDFRRKKSLWSGVM